MLLLLLLLGTVFTFAWTMLNRDKEPQRDSHALDGKFTEHSVL